MWYKHCETIETQTFEEDVFQSESYTAIENDPSHYTFERMVLDASGPSFEIRDTEDTPNPTAQYLYDMLKAANQEV